jgi:hypothetical protein
MPSLDSITGVQDPRCSHVRVRPATGSQQVRQVWQEENVPDCIRDFIPSGRLNASKFVWGEIHRSNRTVDESLRSEASRRTALDSDNA